LELVRIEEFIYSSRGLPDLPVQDRTAIARAFAAKMVYNLPTTRALLDRLETDSALRRICGWERKNDVPDEWTFSRATAEFSASRLPGRVHDALIRKSYANELVGHIARCHRDRGQRKAAQKGTGETVTANSMGSGDSYALILRKTRQSDRQSDIRSEPAQKNGLSGGRFGHFSANSFARGSQEKRMKCVICKTGDIKPGYTTVTLNRGEATVIIKNTPADICDNCGEYYLSEQTTRSVLTRAEQALSNGAEVEVLRWAA
jgi:YgiT-type zinc finger domain-containing protein